MRKIVIIGAGGFGREVQWLIERINQQSLKWDIIGYIDDTLDAGTEINGKMVLGGTEYLEHIETEIAAVCAIGSPKTREKVIKKINKNKNICFPNLIDPSVIKSGTVKMGIGNIICAGNIFTVNINIKDFNIINLDCTIGHDDVFSSFITVYPSVNVSGCVCIGKCVELGTGTQIIQGKNIGENSIIGAGSVVIKDIPCNCTAVGSPCKPIKYHSEVS